MTTKLIAVVIIVGVLYGGWNLFLYWDKVKSEKESVRREAAAAVVSGESLQGMPYGLEQSFQTAKSPAKPGSNWTIVCWSLVMTLPKPAAFLRLSEIVPAPLHLCGLASSNWRLPMNEHRYFCSSTLAAI